MSEEEWSEVCLCVITRGIPGERLAKRGTKMLQWATADLSVVRVLVEPLQSVISLSEPKSSLPIENDGNSVEKIGRRIVHKLGYGWVEVHWQKGGINRCRIRTSLPSRWQIGRKFICMRVAPSWTYHLPQEATITTPTLALSQESPLLEWFLFF